MELGGYIIIFLSRHFTCNYGSIMGTVGIYGEDGVSGVGLLSSSLLLAELSRLDCIVRILLLIKYC